MSEQTTPSFLSLLERFKLMTVTAIVEQAKGGIWPIPQT